MAKLNKLYTRKQINLIKDELRKKHGNCCAICKRSQEQFKVSLSLDHAHSTNKLRGLLCSYCNRFIVGRHNIESATKLLAYLLKYDLPLDKDFNWKKELELRR